MTMRTLTLAGLAVLCLGITVACGSYRIDRYTDPHLAVPAEMALKSTVLAFRDLRMEHGIGVLCIGSVPSAGVRENDVELRAAREAWELELTRMVYGAAPRVHPARECLITGEGQIVTQGDSVPAMMVNVTVPRIVDGRTDPVVQVTINRRLLNRAGAVRYHLLEDEDGWWLDRADCTTNTICTSFNQTAVIWGMPNDGSGPRSAAALQARRRTLEDSIAAARAAADTMLPPLPPRR